MRAWLHLIPAPSAAKACPRPSKILPELDLYGPTSPRFLYSPKEKVCPSPLASGAQWAPPVWAAMAWSMPHRRSLNKLLPLGELPPVPWGPICTLSRDMGFHGGLSGHVCDQNGNTLRSLVPVPHNQD